MKIAKKHPRTECQKLFRTHNTNQSDTPMTIMIVNTVLPSLIQVGDAEQGIYGDGYEARNDSYDRRHREGKLSGTKETIYGQNQK
jgi:hypothetical protein